jgi:hypothetical protein
MTVSIIRKSLPRSMVDDAIELLRGEGDDLPAWLREVTIGSDCRSQPGRSEHRKQGNGQLKTETLTLKRIGDGGCFV